MLNDLKAATRSLLKNLFFQNFFGEASTIYVGSKSGYRIVPISADPSNPIFVISAGVGFDIDFELHLSRLYPANEIVLLDPSQDAANTIAVLGSQLPDSIVYKNLALSSSGGLLTVKKQGNQVQLLTLHDRLSRRSALTHDSLSVHDILRAYSTGYIDILKLDIEGFEYEILFDLLASPVRVGQICVELHDWMLGGCYRLKTFFLFRRLQSSGYLLVSRIHNDYTFAHKSILDSTS